ncbi:MAG: DNA polymerase I [Acidimicrobiales bacterium]|nr:DNA polymerase I [Acidimicrobiales bacterium]
MATLMLIDGNSLTYRAFYALPDDLATASGQVTNAVFGFTSMLINLVRDHKPDGIAVAFDLPQPTFRHERLDTYKAGRKAAPDVLKQQMGLVRQVLEAINLPTLEAAGFEADDIIATLALQAADSGHDVQVVTGDRDAYQLVKDPHVKVIYNRRGVSDYALYDEAGIMERTGVAPKDYVHYAALRGDKSDNLPGVAGVGEKTAAKLINTYGGIDGIYEHIDDHSPKLGQNLAENEDQVRLNAELMTLLTDVELDVAVEELLERKPFDLDEVKKVFDFLEFRTMFDRFLEAFSDDVGGKIADTDRVVITPTVHRIGDQTDVDRWVEKFASSPHPIALAAGVSGGALVGIAFATEPVSAAGSVDVVWVDSRANPGLVRPMLEGTKRSGFAAHDAKPLLRSLLRQDLVGEDFGDGLQLDTALAAYLMDPAGSAYPLEELIIERTEYVLPEADAVPEGQLDFGEGPPSGEVAAARAAAVAALIEPCREALDREGLSKLNSEVEAPLVAVLARMEHRGVGVDRAELERLNHDMTAEADALRAAIHDDAGYEFNVNSTKALREVLFEDLGLTPGKKTKTGYSTDQATLEKLVGEHPIIEHLLAYREVEKLRSTYGASLLAEVQDDDRIRATFNQMVARTGRLSSEHPNLHNIPVRSERGRSFRKAFAAPEGHQLLVADYNQIELRCIAHLAHDPGLVEAFTSGTDVHRSVAARVFDVEPEEVDFEQRSRAKMVSYGLAYGMEAYGLGQRLGIKTSEAAEILDAYFEGFPAVRDYMDRTVTEARNRGYTETLFGRKRLLPELRSDNPRVRQAGERQAMNAGIQGLAADIFKVALVGLDRALTQSGLESRVVLQVHDEVILEVPDQERDTVEQIVRAELASAFELSVPLEVNLAFGTTWADAKSD